MRSGKRRYLVALWLLLTASGPVRPVAGRGHRSGLDRGLLAPIVTGHLVEATGNFNSAFMLAGAMALVGATLTLTLARTPIGEVRAPSVAQPRLAD